MAMSAETKQERRTHRWSTRLPVRYQVFDGRAGRLNIGRISTARARDISSKGLFLSDASLPSGTRLHIFFELPETWGACIEAFGEVVHERARLDAMGFEVAGVGVRLLQMHEHDRVRLEKYLEERQMIDAAVLSAMQVRLRAQKRLQLA
jgi:hypothetical protein